MTLVAGLITIAEMESVSLKICPDHENSSGRFPVPFLESFVLVGYTLTGKRWNAKILALGSLLSLLVIVTNVSTIF